MCSASAVVVGTRKYSRTWQMPSLSRPASGTVIAFSARLGHGCSPRVARSGELVGAIGRDHEQRQMGGVAVEELEQGQRVRVGPLHVVEQQRRGAVAGDLGEQLQRRTRTNGTRPSLAVPPCPAAGSTRRDPARRRAPTRRPRGGHAALGGFVPRATYRVHRHRPSTHLRRQVRRVFRPRRGSPAPAWSSQHRAPR